MRVRFWNWWDEKEFYLIPTIKLKLENKSIEFHVLCIETEILFD